MNKVVLLKRHHKNVTMVVINYTNSKTINLSPPLTASTIWLVSPQSISICLSKNSPLNRHSFLLDGKYFYDSIHSLTTSSQILRLSILNPKFYLGEEDSIDEAISMANHNWTDPVQAAESYWI